MATLSDITSSVTDRFKSNENVLDTAFVYNDSGTLEGKGGCWYADKNSLGDNADVPTPGNDYVVFQIGMRNKADRTQFYCDGNNFSKRQVDNTSDNSFSDWVQQNKAVLTESYKSGASWYRVYSDGWIEQCGNVKMSGSGATTATVTLLKAFSNTNYYVSANYEATSNNQYGQCYTKTTRKFVTKGYGGVINSWYAVGY